MVYRGLTLSRPPSLALSLTHTLFCFLSLWSCFLKDHAATLLTPLLLPPSLSLSHTPSHPLCIPFFLARARSLSLSVCLFGVLSFHRAVSPRTTSSPSSCPPAWPSASTDERYLHRFCRIRLGLDCGRGKTWGNARYEQTCLSHCGGQVLQGYLAHKKHATPEDQHRARGIGLL